MSNLEQTTSWQMIQQGVKEAERLTARKEYNLVMIKARQTLEYMVRCMAERACLVEGDLADTIDQLYEGQWIEKSTKDNFHTIRILGNKAVHEGDDTAYNASQAYHLLTQEVYVFANEFSGQKKPRSGASRSGASRPGTSRSGATGSGVSRPGTARTDSQSGQSQSRSASRQTAATQAGQRPRQTGSRPQQRPAARGNGGKSGARRKKRRPADPVYYILKLLIPVLIVILLIVVIRMMMPDKEPEVNTTTTPAVTTLAPEVPATEPEPATEAPAEEPAESYQISGNSVNVRTEPSTDSRILAQLSAGTPVTYVKRYNNDWTVINYDGQEAYVSSQFLERVEPETEAAPEEGAEDQGDITVE